MLKLMFQWQNQVEEVDRLKGKVKVKKEVNVNLKNRAEKVEGEREGERDLASTFFVTVAHKNIYLIHSVHILNVQCIVFCKMYFILLFLRTVKRQILILTGINL